jgi:NAD-dependent SIR2 family protein deacetylase
MSKRLEFKCHNCPETYTLLPANVKDAGILLVQCPYCYAEAEVDLQPYLSKAHIILRGQKNVLSQIKSLNLPDVLPTQPRS